MEYGRATVSMALPVVQSSLMCIDSSDAILSTCGLLSNQNRVIVNHAMSGVCVPFLISRVFYLLN